MKYNFEWNNFLFSFIEDKKKGALMFWQLFRELNSGMIILSAKIAHNRIWSDEAKHRLFRLFPSENVTQCVCARSTYWLVGCTLGNKSHAVDQKLKWTFFSAIIAAQCLSCSRLYFQVPPRCLAQRRNSININWMNEWMNQWTKAEFENSNRPFT